MKIGSSQIVLQAQHHAEKLHVVSERLQWQAGRAASAAPSAARVGAGAAASLASAIPSLPAEASAASAAAPAAAASTGASTVSEPSSVVSNTLSPHLMALRDMLERLTGRVIRLYGEEDREAPASATHGEGMLRLGTAVPAGQAPSAAASGPSWSYERHELRHESESSHFAARGVIQTADGQNISFELSLSMERSVTEFSSVMLRGGPVQQQDPLVINFDGLAAQLQDQRFSFDLNADGEVEQVALLSGNRGYLALDRNGNGQVDDGSELFGPLTGQGFAELAQFDDDGNNWIDEADAVFQRLQVWMPQVEGAGALRSLSTVGVGAIYLGSVSTPFELKGSDQQSLGTVRSSSVYLTESGGMGTVQQIDLTV